MIRLAPTHGVLCDEWIPGFITYQRRDSRPRNASRAPVSIEVLKLTLNTHPGIVLRRLGNRGTHRARVESVGHAGAVSKGVDHAIVIAGVDSPVRQIWRDQWNLAGALRNRITPTLRVTTTGGANDLPTLEISMQIALARITSTSRLAFCCSARLAVATYIDATGEQLPPGHAACPTPPQVPASAQLLPQGNEIV